MSKKTIFMPRALGEKWLAALRSGEYKQAQGRLEKEGGYCCLGVLQMVADGSVEKSDDGVALGLPTQEWRKAHSVRFCTLFGDTNVVPYLPFFGMYADRANDGDPYTGALPLSFAEIALAIEKAMEFVE